MLRALDILHKARLVDLRHSGTHKDYEHWVLLRDDATERPYTVPGPTQRSVLRLPVSFFYHGWHLVLEPAEIAVLLALIDIHGSYWMSPTTSSQQPSALPPQTRWAMYGITG